MRMERPVGITDEAWEELSERRARDRKKKNAQRAKERYHRIKDAGGDPNMRKGKKEGKKVRNGKLFTMTDEHKAKIAMGVARAKAQRDARKATFAKQDKYEQAGTTPAIKRKYNKKNPIASVQMAGMVNDLERFIANMRVMSAHDYLIGREELIQSIIRRKVDGYDS